MKWPTVSFNEIVRTSQNGFGARRGDGQPNVVLRLADVDSESWSIASSGLRQIGMSADDLAKYKLDQGDLLVVRVNGSPAIAGRVVPYSGPVGFAFCDHFIRFQLVDRADPRFVAYQFRHRPVRSQVERGMVSTAGQHTVSQRTFAGVTVELPPLREQHRIVAAIETHFSRLDAAVASLTRAKANVKRARASVLKAAVEGRLVPTEAALARAEGRDYEPATVLLDRILAERKAAHERAQEGAKRKKKYKEPVKPETEGLPELPEGWCWATMDALLHRIEAGKSFAADNTVPSAGQVGVVKVSAVTWGTYNENEAKTVHDPARINRGYFIQRGDLLISRANTIELVGAAVIAERVTRRTMLSDKILRLNMPVQFRRFTLWVLRSQHGRHQIEALATGNQESMRNIGQNRIRQIAIPLPPSPSSTASSPRLTAVSPSSTPSTPRSTPTSPGAPAYVSPSSSAPSRAAWCPLRPTRPHSPPSRSRPSTPTGALHDP